jgi:uncharacterized membrane protein YhfC
VHNIVYFAGPFVLGIAGAILLRQRFRVFVIGLVTFLLAWIVMQSAAAVATQGFGVTERSLLYALIVSLLAAVCEEPARYIAFRRLPAFRGNHNWRSSLTYALGHHGLETIVVGLTILLVTLVVRYKPDAISDPVTLRDCQAAVALGSGTKLYNAFERLSVGLLIHACFSGVVMLAVARGRTRWLFAAMAWHFAHNMVGFNLHRLSDHWLTSKGWIAIVVIGYSYLAVRVYRALAATVSRPHASDTPPSPSPMILPGRLGPLGR